MPSALNWTVSTSSVEPSVSATRKLLVTVAMGRNYTDGVAATPKSGECRDSVHSTAELVEEVGHLRHVVLTCVLLTAGRENNVARGDVRGIKDRCRWDAGRLDIALELQVELVLSRRAHGA